mmetsp:Transcript_5160/g.9800  ORF Transcript_5160/g.9800 Transcript_5160/m.9800 type:complete len:258 (-) Transcript_5160:261-1034(-)
MLCKYPRPSFPDVVICVFPVDFVRSLGFLCIARQLLGLPCDVARLPAFLEAPPAFGGVVEAHIAPLGGLVQKSQSLRHVYLMPGRAVGVNEGDNGRQLLVVVKNVLEVRRRLAPHVGHLDHVSKVVHELGDIRIFVVGVDDVRVRHELLQPCRVLLVVRDYNHVILGGEIGPIFCSKHFQRRARLRNNLHSSQIFHGQGGRLLRDVGTYIALLWLSQSLFFQSVFLSQKNCFFLSATKSLMVAQVDAYAEQYVRKRC